jgi:hypothetical protein
MDNKKQNDVTYEPKPHFDYLRASSSGMDCTGSVPRPPESDAELESYLDTYSFLPLAAVEDEAMEDV